jgi:hypothetical protein
MVLNIAAGQVAVPVGLLQSVLCTSTAVETVTLDPAPPSGTNRIDLVVCEARSADWGGANEDFIFTKVNGAQASSPVAPAVPAQSVAIAQVYVAGGSASVTAANITDRRGAGLTVPTLPAGRIFATGQTVAQPNTPTSIVFAGVTHTSGGMQGHTTAGYGQDGLIMPVDGTYLLAAMITWQQGGTGTLPAGIWNCNFRKNGGTDVSWFSVAHYTTGNPRVVMVDMVRAVAGDWYGVVGAGQTILSGSYGSSPLTYLTAALLSA